MLLNLFGKMEDVGCIRRSDVIGLALIVILQSLKRCCARTMRKNGTSAGW